MIAHETVVVNSPYYDENARLTVCYYMSRMSLRVNLHSVVCRNVKELHARSSRHI